MKHFCRSTIVRSALVASLAIAGGIGSLCAPEHAWSAQINDQTDPQTLIQTVTRQILDEVRQQALTPDDIPRIMIIVNRDILPYVDIRRTTQYARTTTTRVMQLNLKSRCRSGLSAMASSTAAMPAMAR